MKNSLGKIWPLVFSFLLFQLSEVGLVVAFIFGGLGYASKSLIYIIPILVADVLLLLRIRSRQVFSSINLNRLGFVNLILATTFLFIASIAILIFYQTRPWAYFIVISLISGLIFAQIIIKKSTWADYLIIFEIILLSLNLIWGVSLKYPLYFGNTDVLIHLSYIKTVVQTGHLEGIGIDYLHYPLFHIFNAIGIDLTGLSLRTGLFIVIGILWQIGILFAYLIFKKFSNSRAFSLMACLLFALSSEIIYYGSYAVTRSLGFVFILCFFYLILQKARIKYIIITVITIFALITTHHATVLFFVPVIIIIYAFQNLFNRDVLGRIKIQSIGVQLLLICFFVYIIYVDYKFSYSSARNWMTNLISTNEANLNIGPSAAIITAVYYSFVLFFSVFGIGMSFSKNKLENTHRSIISIALITLIFLLFYVPGPINLIPYSSIALLYRLPLLVTPFVIYMMAYGLNQFIYFEQNIRQRIFKRSATSFPLFTLSLAVIITFFSTICGSNAIDNSYILKASAAGSQYFTNTELVSFSFINNNVDHSSSLFSDFQTMRNEFYFENYPVKQTITRESINNINNGYLIFRVGELKRAGLLLFSNDDKYFLEEPNMQTNNFLNNLSTKDCVYSDTDVQIYWVR